MIRFCFGALNKCSFSRSCLLAENTKFPVNHEWLCNACCSVFTHDDIGTEKKQQHQVSWTTNKECYKLTTDTRD